jgi:hypothetical protein
VQTKVNNNSRLVRAGCANALVLLLKTSETMTLRIAHNRRGLMMEQSTENAARMLHLLSNLLTSCPGKGDIKVEPRFGRMCRTAAVKITLHENESGRPKGVLEAASLCDFEIL